MNNRRPAGARASIPRTAARPRTDQYRLAILLLALAVLALSLRLAHAAEAAPMHGKHVPAAATPTGISITNAWARATPPGMNMSAAYLVITNRGTQADVLIDASSPIAAGVEIHRTTLDGGVSRMRPAGQISIAPGGTIQIEPSGLHMMLVGLKGPLIEARTLPLTLQFRSAGAVTVQVAVRPLVDTPIHAGH